MKKRWLCAFIALFFLVCSVPLTAMCLAGPAPAAANEIAAPKPKLIRRGALNTAFLSELSAYASRGFRPRLWCITAWDAVCARLFGASENDDVVLGRDGWLFYFTAADDRAGSDPDAVHQHRPLDQGAAVDPDPGGQDRAPHRAP